jgi:hypothetical protein
MDIVHCSTQLSNSHAVRRGTLTAELLCCTGYIKHNCILHTEVGFPQLGLSRKPMAIIKLSGLNHHGEILLV